MALRGAPAAAIRMPALLLLQLTNLVVVAEAVASNKGFFEVEWEDPTKAALELGWRAVKVCLALSPLIAITMLFCCTKDDPEEEALRRKKKYDFSLAGED